MIILTATTDNLQLALGGSVTSDELDVLTSWRDITTTAYTPGRTVATSNGTSDVNIVPAPGSSTQRVVDMINVKNLDTADATVTIKFDANGTEYVLLQEVLAPGDSIHYADGLGFSIERTYKPLLVFPVHVDATANFAMTNATQAERFALNTTRHIFIADLDGYTQVRMWGNKMVGSASVNTPLFRAKYYTSYNTTVGNFLQLGQSSQVEFSMTSTGFADTGWLSLATGARINGCCIGFTELGGDAAADPALGVTSIMFR